MRKNPAGMILGVLSLLWAGCGSQPVWFSNSPPHDESFVYGVGRARGSNADQSRALAETKARASLASRISTAMGTIQVPGSEGADPLIIPLPELDLGGAVVEKSEAVSGGRHYIMISYPKKMIRR